MRNSSDISAPARATGGELGHAQASLCLLAIEAKKKNLADSTADEAVGLCAYTVLTELTLPDPSQALHAPA